jgi:hypothetical protein
VSGFAIASLIVSGSFAAIVLTLGIYALYTRAPLLLPLVVQILPYVGVALALVALFLINRSEKTLAGRFLALCGLWLSIVFGLSYLAYYMATYFAIRDQADRYTQSFLDKLKDGKTIVAFLDTLDPRLRAGVADPNNESEILLRFNRQVQRGGGPQRRGTIDMFRASPMVHFLEQGGKETVIEPLGIKTWDYANDGYEVQRVYRVKSSEGVFDLLIPVRGAESRTHEFEGRKWSVDYPRVNVVRSEISEQAKNIQKLRGQVAIFVQKWGQKLVRGDLEGAYLDTRDPSERSQLKQQYRGRQAASAVGRAVPTGFGGSLFGLAWLPLEDSDLDQELYLPGYKAAFCEGRLVKTEKLQAETEAFRADTIRGLRAVLGGPIEPPLTRRPESQINIEQQGAPERYTIQDGRLSFNLEIHLGILIPPIRHLCIGRMLLESDPGPFDMTRDVRWRIVELDLSLVEDFDKMMMLRAPAGGMGPGGPPGP